MASKSSIEAGRGHVVLATDSTLLEKGLAAASDRFKAWGEEIGALGAGIAAIGTTITAPFIYGLTVFADWGMEMRSSMRLTGIGFESLHFLMHGLRVSSDELVPAVAKMSAFLIDAAHGSAEANATLHLLGITLDELSGAAHGDRVLRLAEAIGSVADATQRIALQRQVFGRGGLALNIQGGAEGIRARARRMDFIEGTPTEADQRMGAAYAIAQKEMGLAIKAVWREVGAAAAPVMTAILSRLVNLIVGIRDFVHEHRVLLGYVFILGGALLSVGTAMVAVGSAIWLAGAGLGSLFGAVGSFFGSLFSLGKALSTVSFALFALRIVTTLLGLPVLTIGLYGVSAVLLLVKGAFAAVALAAWSYGTAVASATYVALTAFAVLKIALAILVSGFGVLTVLGKIMALGAVINGAIASAAMFAYGVALGVVNFIMSLSTASVTGFAFAELFASIATTILTGGLNLLVGTLAILIITVGAVVLAFGALWAVGLMVVAAASGLRDFILHFGDALEWLTDLAHDVTTFFGDLPALISDAWQAFIVTPIASFIEKTISLFEELRALAISTWTTIGDYLDKLNSEFEEAGLNDFGRNMLYLAIGIAAVAGALGYVIYDLYTTYTLAELLNMLWEQILGVIAENTDAIVELIHEALSEIYALFDNTFLGIADFINDTLLGIVNTVLDFVETILNALGMLAVFVDWIEGLREVMVAALEAISGLLEGVMPDIAGFLQEILDEVLAYGAEIWAAFLQSFSFDSLLASLHEFIAGVKHVFTDLIAWINDNIEEILDPFIRLGRDLVGQVLALATALRDNFEEMFQGVWSAITAIGPAIERIGSIASTAAGQTMEGFNRAFSGISASAGLAFSAVKDAFALGDWERLWQVIKITAMIAWQYVSQFLQETWIAWRFAAARVFNIISDYIRVGLTDSIGAVQTFYERFWMEIRALAETGAGSVLKTFWELAAGIIEALDRPLKLLQRLVSALAMVSPEILGIGDASRELNAISTSDLAGRARTAGATAVTDAGTEATRIRNEQTAGELQRQLERERARVAREARDAGLNEEEARARAAVGGGAIPELEDELRRIQHWLEEERFMREIAAAETGGGPEGFGAMVNKQTATGSFFADALRASFGGGQVSAADRTARGILRMVEQNDIIIRELQRIQPIGFA